MGWQDWWIVFCVFNFSAMWKQTKTNRENPNNNHNHNNAYMPRSHIWQCSAQRNKFFSTRQEQSDIHTEVPGGTLSGGPPYAISLARVTHTYPSPPTPWWQTKQQWRDTHTTTLRANLKLKYAQASLHQPEEGLPSYQDITRVHWYTDLLFVLFRPKNCHMMNWRAMPPGRVTRKDASSRNPKEETCQDTVVSGYQYSTCSLSQNIKQEENQQIQPLSVQKSLNS